MKKIKDYSALIKRTLAKFDFGKVHEYMKQNDWEWVFRTEMPGEVRYRVPTIGELYQKAEELLHEAEAEALNFPGVELCGVESCGFHALADIDSIKLYFVIESKLNKAEPEELEEDNEAENDSI